MSKLLTPSEWLKETGHKVATEKTMKHYADYCVDFYRKQQKYYFNGRIFTEEGLRGKTVSEDNAPVLIKEEIAMPEKIFRFSDPYSLPEVLKGLISWLGRIRILLQAR